MVSDRFDFEKLLDDVCSDDPLRAKKGSSGLREIPPGLERDPEPFLNALRSENETRRHWGLVGLQRLMPDPDDVLPEVSERIKCDCLWVQNAALETMTRYCELANQYAGLIAERIDCGEMFVQHSALRALADIGPLPSVVLERLVEAMDDDKMIGVAATSILELGPRAALIWDDVKKHAENVRASVQLNSTMDVLTSFDGGKEADFISGVENAKAMHIVCQNVNLLSFLGDRGEPSSKVFKTLLALKDEEDVVPYLASKAIRRLAPFGSTIRKEITSWKESLNRKEDPDHMISANLHVALLRMKG